MTPLRRITLVCVASMAIGVAGCSTTAPATHYHSLVAPPVSTGQAAKAMPAPGVRFEVLQVSVPSQVDVPQMVLRLPDGSLAVLEHERWIAPLSDEIRAVVTLRVEQALLPSSPGAVAVADRVWRVRLDVQRFDSMLGRAASVQVQWSLHAGGGTALRCQASYEEPVAAGAAALAAGHRALFERLGDVIGQALKAAASGGTPSCG